MLQGGMSGQDGVVWLDDSGRNLGSRVDCKLELRLLAVVHRETLHQQGSEPRTGTSTKGAENQESLESGALV